MSLSYQLQHCYQGQQADMLCSIVQLRVITHAMQLLLAMQLNIDVTDRWGGIKWGWVGYNIYITHFTHTTLSESFMREQAISTDSILGKYWGLVSDE